VAKSASAVLVAQGSKWCISAHADHPCSHSSDTSWLLSGKSASDCWLQYGDSVFWDILQSSTDSFALFAVIVFNISIYSTWKDDVKGPSEASDDMSQTSVGDAEAQTWGSLCHIICLFASQLHWYQNIWLGDMRQCIVGNLPKFLCHSFLANSWTCSNTDVSLTSSCYMLQY